MKRKISISLFFAGLTICLCMGILIGSLINRPKNTLQDNVGKKELQLIKRPENVIIDDKVYPVSVSEDTITADTTYMILEKDINTGNIITNLSKMPEKYIGMTREKLMAHLDDLESNPPLTELERGFVSLELISFSPMQVEIQMNYQEIEPTGIFYIMAYDHKLLVMLEDKKTVFLATEIPISDLPPEVQQDVMKGLFIPNELALYDFLENYTS